MPNWSSEFQLCPLTKLMLKAPKMIKLKTMTSCLQYSTNHRQNKVGGERKVFTHTPLWPGPCFLRSPPSLWLNYIVKATRLGVSFLFYIKMEPLGFLAHILN